MFLTYLHTCRKIKRQIKSNNTQFSDHKEILKCSNNNTQSKISKYLSKITENHHIGSSRHTQSSYYEGEKEIQFCYGSFYLRTSLPHTQHPLSMSPSFFVVFVVVGKYHTLYGTRIPIILFNRGKFMIKGARFQFNIKFIFNDVYPPTHLIFCFLLFVVQVYEQHFHFVIYFFSMK